VTRSLPLLVLAAMLQSGWGTPAPPEDESPPVRAAADSSDVVTGMGLLLASFHERMLDAPYSEATERLLDACGSYREACFREHHEPVELVVDTLRAGPSLGREPVAVLVARLVVPEGPGTLGYRLLARPADGGPDRLLRRLGDWGYGVGFVVREWTRDGWTRLPDSAAARGGWMSTGTGGLRGGVGSPAGRVWRLESVEARRTSSGETVTVEAGVYWILAVEEGTVRFRPELPSDMACGRDVPPDPPDPPVYESAVEAFFAADGSPRLERAYPRGC